MAGAPGASRVTAQPQGSGAPHGASLAGLQQLQYGPISGWVCSCGLTGTSTQTCFGRRGWWSSLSAAEAVPWEDGLSKNYTKF